MMRGIGSQSNCGSLAAIGMTAMIKNSVPLAFIFGLAAIRAHAQTRATVPGWSVTVRIGTEFGDGSSGNTTTMRQRLSDHAIRWEIDRVSSPTGPVNVTGPFAGQYTIVNVVDSTTTMVMPAQRRATVTSYPIPRANASTADVGRDRRTRRG
jgi:hypothetical protein